MIARETISYAVFCLKKKNDLSSSPQTLPCKLFYDQAGSALFEQITSLPEYYLTRTELQILHERGTEIAEAVGPGVTVVELGSGTATKTTTLLQAFSHRQLRVEYFPVDISPAALAEARERVESQCSRVSVRPVIADFGDGFRFLRTIPGPKLVLYL